MCKHRNNPSHIRNNQGNKLAKKENKISRNQTQRHRTLNLNDRIQDSSYEKLNEVQENSERQFNGLRTKFVNKRNTLPRRLKL